MALLEPLVIKVADGHPQQREEGREEGAVLLDVQREGEEERLPEAHQHDDEDDAEAGQRRRGVRQGPRQDLHRREVAEEREDLEPDQHRRQRVHVVEGRGPV